MPRKTDWDLWQEKLRRFQRLLEMDRIWPLDTEFQTTGGRPVPICLCAKDLLSGEHIEMFCRDGEQPVNPFTDYDRSVFVGHSLAAEWGVFIALGWELPPNCIDTMFEFGYLTNQKKKRDLVAPCANGRSLLDACEYFGIETMDCAAKTNERDNIIVNGRVAPVGVEQADRERRILDYCWEDVHVTEQLFWGMVKLLDCRQAMLRGSY